MAGSLARSILSGQRYPRSLLGSVISRIRTDGKVTGVRVALCKAILARNIRLDNQDNQKEVPVSLDSENKEPGYLFGRLFAVLESIQEVALGEVNASITDRYYASASAIPEQVFFLLLKGAKHHIARARKGPKRKLVFSLEWKVKEIIDLIDGNFPKSLSMEQQSWFAIGYYHQYQGRFGSDPKTDEAEEITEEDTENTQ
jgi:CRISPR-associated protein Csd1